MKKIGGNVDCVLKYQSTTQSDIGEDVVDWVELQTIKGFLDLMNSGKEYANYNKPTEDSTHVFVCDYVSIEKKDQNGNDRQFKATIDGEDFDVTYIDDPMKLHYQLEIFLRRVV